MDKIIFGTKSEGYMGYAVRDIIPKFSLHLPTSHFENLNPTEVEISQSSNIIERIFQTKISALDKLKLDLIYQLKNLIILLLRSEEISPILENIVNGFENKIIKKWKSEYSTIFDGAMIFNGIVGTKEEPINKISQILFDNNLEDLNEEQKKECVSYAILIKEVFYSFTLLKESIEKLEKIPRLELLYEVYKKSNSMLQVLFKDKKLIFDNKPLGDLMLYRKSRNAYSHLSLIFNGNCFNWGEVMAIERNMNGDYLGVIKSEKIVKLRWDLTYLLCFLSQMFCIFPLMIRSNEQSSTQSKKKEAKPQLFIDYMSGQVYILEKCPFCKKEITKGIENTVRVPKIEIEINKKDEKLDKLYPVKHKINKPKTFCNLECFINYIKDNTSEEICLEIISSFK